MSVFVFSPSSNNPNVDWDSALIWAGGVVPNSLDADVSLLTIYSGPNPYPFNVTIGNQDNLKARSLSIENNNLYVSGTLAVTQLLKLGASSLLNVSAPWRLSVGALQNDAGSIYGSGQIQVAGATSNNSFIYGNGLALSSDRLTNNGTLEALGGSLTVTVQPGRFSNLVGSTLSGGIYKAQGGNLYMNVGGAVEINSATIDLEEGGSVYFFDPLGQQFVSILNTLKEIGAQGRLTVGKREYSTNNNFNFATINNKGVIDLNNINSTFGEINVASGGVVNLNA